MIGINSPVRITDETSGDAYNGRITAAVTQGEYWRIDAEGLTVYANSDLTRVPYVLGSDRVSIVEVEYGLYTATHLGA